MAIVNTGVPIDLFIENQYNSEGAPVFYIVSEGKQDEPCQQVNFRIRNAGNISYTLVPIPNPSAQNYHFALKFRPGTLRYNDKSEIKAKFEAATGSSMYVSELTVESDQAETIYLSPKVRLTLETGKDIAFQVNNLSAEPGTGSRSTNVQLNYKLPVTGGTTPLSGVRNKIVDIINRQGKSNAPLEFVVLGDPALIHRSQNNSIRLQLVETGGQKFNVSEKTYIAFRFPYYTGDYDPNYHPAWVFGKNDNVNLINYEKDPKETTILTIKKVDLSVKETYPETAINIDHGAWGYKTIQLTFPKKEAINNLILQFKNIPADGPVGFASIKITVKNLPGYWDTDFEVKLEKTLLSTKYYEAGKRSYGMLSNQAIVGNHLPGDYQMNKALDSSLFITSANINDGTGKKDVSRLLYLHDGKLNMNGLDISVGNWEKGDDYVGKGKKEQDLPTPSDNPTTEKFLIKADQYNYGIRFQVDFLGNLFADGNIFTNKKLFVGDNKVSDTVKKDWEQYNPKHKDDPAIIFLPKTQLRDDHAWISFHTKDSANTAHNLEIMVGDNDNDHLVLKSINGNVGIGTNDPKEKIHLVGKTKIEGETLIENNLRVGTPANPGKLHVEGRVTDQTGELMPVGSIIAYGGTTIPEGWLECNNQEITNAKYAELKKILGRDRVPDLRSRFIVGTGSAASVYDPRKDASGNYLSAYNLNNTGGEEKHKLTVDEMPKHWHYTWGEASTDAAPWGASPEKGHKGSRGSWDNDNYYFKTDEAGGDAVHNNLPPYYALRYIIKY